MSVICSVCGTKKVELFLAGSFVCSCPRDNKPPVSAAPVALAVTAPAIEQSKPEPDPVVQPRAGEICSLLLILPADSLASLTRLGASRGEDAQSFALHLMDSALADFIVTRGRGSQPLKHFINELPVSILVGSRSTSARKLVVDLLIELGCPICDVVRMKPSERITFLFEAQQKARFEILNGVNDKDPEGEEYDDADDDGYEEG